MPLESRRQSLAVRIGCGRAGWGREPRHTLVVTDEHASRTSARLRASCAFVGPGALLARC
jgi:hypothetical protein